MAIFEVLHCWSNRDATHEVPVAEWPDRETAEKDADNRNREHRAKYPNPGECWTVREKGSTQAHD